LSATSLAELLVLSLERRLSGSFVFETPISDKSALVVEAGRVTKVRTAEAIDPLGRLLTDSGVIDPATLELGLRRAQEQRDRLGDALLQLDAVERDVLERMLREQLGRRLSWLGQLPEQSAYGFYANVDFLDDRPPCGADPLALIWRCVRDGRAAHPRQESVLSSIGARPLSLRARPALERFELSDAERAWIERLHEGPLSLDVWLARGGVEYVRARRLAYAMLITRQLEVAGGRGVSLSPPSLRPSSPPSEPPRAAGAPRARETQPPPSLRPASLAPASRRSQPSSSPGSRPASAPPAPAARSVPPESSPPSERVEHALERASRLVRERARAEGAAEAARMMEVARDLMARKQLSEAERLAHRACEADPSNPEHLAFHAWLRMQNGDLAVPALATQVVAALDRAVMKAPGSVSVRFYRAQVLKRLGRDDEAYRDFRFVARRAPEHLDAVREVRLHLMRTRNKQKQSGVFSKLFLR
jgi:tetratricopeptide (TPR) repeat protein